MASGPLDGTRVLEFTQIVAGPLGCQLLSDLGAEVIKVEPVNGEAWRYAGAFLPAESKWFHSLNRGKQSLAINITDPQAQEAIHRLVRNIDVVVINYRPDVAARLGIDYDTLAELNPALIYVDNTAFGREGAFAARPGYDIVVQALCGLIATGGKLNDDGVPVSGQPPIADTTTGYAIAVAVCAALFYRGKTGKGQKIETSLMINALLVNNVHFASIPCLPQPGITDPNQFLDLLSYRQRPTWRLAFRHDGNDDVMVTNQSVEATPAVAGLRWYELRRRNNGTYSLRQQGTYAPGDGIHRWMGSVAMDKKGNMGLGYSVVNATDVFPGVRYTGRLANDPLGQMTLGEAVLVNGTAAQTSLNSRWGDYSSMNVDPIDDCTFWYVNEYYTVEGAASAPLGNGWQTRIGSFRLPGC